MSDRKQQTGAYRDPVTGKTPLKTEMDRQGITGAELARRVGMSGMEFRRYARGETKASLELAVDIS